jgi:NAD(P)H-dependent FMN reductase
MTSQTTRSTAVPAAADLSDDPADDLAVAVILGSVRRDRIGEAILRWVTTRASTEPGMRVDIIDLAKETLPPAADLQPGGSLEPTDLAVRIMAADAYLMLTPEYNHSIPAPLKHAIDCHYHEWQFKAAAVIGYGVLGGVLAVEHLRQIFGELRVVTAHRAVYLARPWTAMDEQGNFVPDGAEAASPAAAALDATLRELAWWARALRTARQDAPFRD